MNHKETFTYVDVKGVLWYPVNLDNLKNHREGKRASFFMFNLRWLFNHNRFYNFMKRKKSFIFLKTLTVLKGHLGKRVFFRVSVCNRSSSFAEIYLHFGLKKKNNYLVLFQFGQVFVGNLRD